MSRRPKVRNRTGGEKSKYPPEPFDWYVEEQFAVDLLLEAERFEGEIVDPCCGMGMIPSTAMRHGYQVRGFDLVDRLRLADFPFEDRDLLDPALWESVPRFDNTVFNPPYSYEKGIAERCIRRALEMTRRKVAALLPNKFNSSIGRYPLFTETPLARIHWLCSRPSMPPGSALISGAVEFGGGIPDYAWFVWDRAHLGPSTNNYLILPQDLAVLRKKLVKKEAASDG